jgi:hypothetical protein
MWCVKLSDSQRDAVNALIRAQGELGPALTGALEALDYARWDDLPDAELPWDRVIELAQVQGIGEADVVWDLAAGMPTGKTPSKPRPKGSAARRAAKSARR